MDLDEIVDRSSYGATSPTVDVQYRIENVGQGAVLVPRKDAGCADPELRPRINVNRTGNLGGRID
jgi:hypothetical protein